MAVVKKGNKASFEAPVDGMITAVNPKVCAKPSLLHDDPYGEGSIVFRQTLDTIESLIREQLPEWLDLDTKTM